jgi:dipeptidyl-peptidase-4
MLRKIFFRPCLLILSFTALATNAQKKQVDAAAIVQLNGNPGFLNPLPGFMRWTDDTHFLINKRIQADSVRYQVYLVDAKTGAEVGADPNLIKLKNISIVPVVKNGDIFLKSQGKDIQLTKTVEIEYNPTFSPDSVYIAFTRNNDLYTVRVSDGKETRLTTDGSFEILNGYASWVYMEEILGRATAYRAFWWSPDSKHLAFFRSDDSNVPIFTITDGDGQHGHIEKQHYPKAGDHNPEIKIGIVQPDGGKVTWAAFNQKDDQYFGKPYWRPDGKALWVQWMNREQDSLKIFEVDLKNGEKKEIYNEYQKTWIALDDDNRIEFLSNGKGFILMSDKTGWRHAYLYNMKGLFLNAITTGSYTVKDIQYVDEKAGVIYFLTNKDHPNQNDLYRVNFNGKDLKRLTFGTYHHNVNLSPSASFFVTKYSNASTPDRLALVDGNGKLIKELGDSKGPAFADYSFPKSEVMYVKSEDGKYDLPMRVTWPVNKVPGKLYPVSIGIYGGPNSPTIQDSWVITGSKEEDIIYVNMDHRGSGEYGKEGQNYMHRRLGYWEMKDWIQCVKWLIANGQADPSRILISGYSYGGFMTCYALTYGADYFTHGIAGGSVTDWRLYDSHYTERYMDSPAENPEGYKNSSVLTYADKLKGKLTITHGVIDDNVHLQNSLQLISKLQELNKDFDMMLYPGNRHSVFGPKMKHYNSFLEKIRREYLFPVSTKKVSKL